VATEEEEPAGTGEDLSVPMWVWTLLGFALVTAVLIVVIIRGGAGRGADQTETYEDDPTAAETQPADTQPTTEPAATQPATRRRDAGSPVNAMLAVIPMGA
jgi:hypothetical protein